MAIAAGAQNVDFWGAVWKGAAAGAIGGFIGGGLSALGQAFESVSFFNNPWFYGPISGSGGSVTGAAFYGMSGTDLAIAAGLGAGAGLFAAGLGLALNRLSHPQGKVNTNGERVSPRMLARLLKLSKLAGGKEVLVHAGRRTLAEQRALYDAGLTTNSGSDRSNPAAHIAYDGVDISTQGLSHRATAGLAYRSGLFNRVALYSGHVHVDLRPVPAGPQFFFANPRWIYAPGGP